jgi:hypothetical protein
VGARLGRAESHGASRDANDRCSPGAWKNRISRGDVVSAASAERDANYKAILIRER